MSRLNEVFREYEELGIRQQLNYDKFYLYSIITHSTAIEGSTVSEAENRLLFEDGIGAAANDGTVYEFRLKKSL